MVSKEILVVDCEIRARLLLDLETFLCAGACGEVQFKRFSTQVGRLLQSSPRDSLGELSSIPAVVVLCLPSGGIQIAREFFSFLRDRRWDCPVLAIMEDAKEDEARQLLQLGIDDYIVPPLTVAELLPRLYRLLARATEDEMTVQHLKETLGLRQFLGQSPALLNELHKVPAIARHGASVLISGETGTGKEMFARAIHHLSPRSTKPFVAVNCGAIPIELMENELFGHTAGAFTGASSTTVGLVNEADGGTLFLDEIDSLPLSAQVKLLRFLQEREYRALGSTKLCKSDVRVISASNVDFADTLRLGRFRQDLYYRLAVIPLALPPLRARLGDVPLLARHFMEKYSDAFGKRIRNIAATAMQKLMVYRWPGNVRELENVMERAVVFCEDTTIRSEHILLPVAEGGALSFQEAKARVVAQFEQAYIRDLLNANDGNISRAARSAKKPRRAFWELIRKHQIIVKDTVPLPRSERFHS